MKWKTYAYKNSDGIDKLSFWDRKCLRWVAKIRYLWASLRRSAKKYLKPISWRLMIHGARDLSKDTS